MWFYYTMVRMSTNIQRKDLGLPFQIVLANTKVVLRNEADPYVLEVLKFILEEGMDINVFDKQRYTTPGLFVLN